MRHWFTRPGAPLTKAYVKRFDPLHWTVDFPRGTMAALVTSADDHGLTVIAEYFRKGDLVGLIFDSEDHHAHHAHRRETNLDYSGCVLRFDWQSSGLVGLDSVNGPTLTIEGRDGSGNRRSWYVRLWNYAQGSPTAASITLSFDSLDAGFAFPDDAVRVDPRSIDRMFISLPPSGFVAGSLDPFAMPLEASVQLSNIRCDGPGSVLAINDAVAPEHELRIATAYDDMYHLAPARVVEWIERLGYRGTINHYVGMSHYFALDGGGKIDAARALNGPALEWHRALTREARGRGYELIWSLSFELLDMFCPDTWKQRAYDGTPAATAYVPPSALVSPANVAAIDHLGEVAKALIGLSVEAGLAPQLQIGEPWWWVTSSGEPCLYDDAAKTAFGGNPIAIGNVRGVLNPEQTALLDQAGTVLSTATASIVSAARNVAANTKSLLLIYLPSVLDPSAPEVRRANLPIGWARPAFDVLQIEDYEWVTGGGSSLRSSAYSQVDARLGYARTEQHYISGFVAQPADRGQWPAILAAADQARRRGVGEVFLWALPQVVRDGLTLFGEDEIVTPFEDVMFPLEIGAEASAAPAFSTNVVTSASGYEYRNVNWQQARLRFDAGPGVRGDSELETLIAFFRARRGAAVGFRFRDPFDHSSNGMVDLPSAQDQLIGTGDGAASSFALVKCYGEGEKRRITRPVPGSVRVSVNGIEIVTGWTVELLGIVQFDQPPAAGAQVRAGFQFDVPVRFADDRLEVNRATFRAGEAPSVPLVEIREG